MTKTVIAALLGLIVAPAVVWSASWLAPFQIGEDFECGQSPFGFHRGRLVFFEWVDYGGGTYQTYGDSGGLLDYAAILFGLRPNCPRDWAG